MESIISHSVVTKTEIFKDQENLSAKDLILIKDGNIHPLKWNLGRIFHVHPSFGKKVNAVARN